MNKKRLLTLADYLETVPRQRFKMTSWATDKFCGKPKEPEHDCKSSACAVGWACTIPSFKRAGLKMKFCPFEGPYPEFNYSRGFDAADAFFDLEWRESDYLFGSRDHDGKPRSRETPKQVAKRIRKFVESNGEIPCG